MTNQTMELLVCDSETTIWNKGNWADKRNKLVMLGFKYVNSNEPIIYTEFGKSTVNHIQEMVNACDIFIGFAFKFDLHWLLNIGIDLSRVRRVHDCQIAEFLLEAQRNPYNSLNDALAKYDYPLKLDVVKTEYWDKGKDTTEVPLEILREYLEYDLIGTERVFKRQYEQFTGIQL